MMACIGEPVSWPRLEAFALDGRDAAIRAHLGACPACARCLDEITTDVVALPVLVVPERAPKRRWWTVLVPAMALAAAALIALVLWRRGAGDDRVREDMTWINGVGEVTLGLVRERDGAIRDDATTFLPGDRFKIVITCSPSASVAVETAVIDPHSIDTPLPPARIACGNRVVLPGAFSLTGDAPNQICIRVGTGEMTPESIRAGAPGVACTTVTPE